MPYFAVAAEISLSATFVMSCVLLFLYLVSLVVAGGGLNLSLDEFGGLVSTGGFSRPASLSLDGGL